MKQSDFKRYSRYGQIGVWIFLFLIYFMETVEDLGIFKTFLYALATILLLMGTAYFHYYRLLPLFNKGKKFIYFSMTLLLILLCSYLIYEVMIFYPDEDGYQYHFGATLIYNILLTTIIVGAVSLNYFVDAWYHNIKKESLLKSEKLEAELNFLKSQINPHFLFNTLNNIYSYAQMGNEKTAPMLERLSSILRFMVYDCSEDRVQLSKEITAVEDLLEIHKMKNSDQRNIELQVDGVKGFHLIAPLIIVNFVENACKHSDVISNPNGFIQVHITVSDTDECHLKISNSVKLKTAPRSKYQGLGLENIRKRLLLQYGDAYFMKEELSNGQYHLNLKIPLERKK